MICELIGGEIYTLFLKKTFYISDFIFFYVFLHLDEGRFFLRDGLYKRRYVLFAIVKEGIQFYASQINKACKELCRTKTRLMGMKKIATGIALLFMMLPVGSWAQEVNTDAVEGNGRADSLQVLSNELAQIKSQVSAVEKEQRDAKIWSRKKYWKLGFGNPTLERTDGEDMTWKTDFAVSIQRGKTIYFHSKPLWGMVKIGLDYGFMDLSYAKLKLKSFDVSDGESSTVPGIYTGSNDGFDEIESSDPDGSVISMLGVDLGMHKFEYGFHVGPSVSVNPWNHLIVSAYFHAMPTASGILENDKFSYGFGCAMAAGVSVSYKVISVGVEGVWSNIKYRQVSFDEDESEDDNLFNTKSFKLKQKDPRFYVAFRF